MTDDAKKLKAPDFFLSEEDYKTDIYDLFSRFDFETDDKLRAGEDPPDIEQQCIDTNVCKMVFQALGKPLSDQTIRAMDLESQKLGIVGVSYPMFERQYLKAFPYNRTALLDEAISYMSQGRDVITMEDLKRVVKKIHSTFTDAQLESIMRVLGKKGEMTVSQVKETFLCLE